MRVKSRRPLFRDPTTRYIGRDDLDHALSRLEPELVELLAAHVYGVTPGRLARRMDTGGFDVLLLLLHALRKIRDSPGGEGLVEELRTDHGPRYSQALRTIAQRMRIDGVPRCRRCAKPLTAATTGRPRQYCGNACRQAAYRQRIRDSAVNAKHDHGLTPPPPGQELVPLPSLAPFSNYEPYALASDRHLQMLLDRWAGRARRAWPGTLVVHLSSPTGFGKSIHALRLLANDDPPSIEHRAAELAAELLRNGGKSPSATVEEPAPRSQEPLPYWLPPQRPPKVFGPRCRLSHAPRRWVIRRRR